MAETSRSEVESNHVLAGNVLVVIYGEPEPERCQQRILAIRIPVECLRAITEVVVHLADEIVLYERLAKTYPDPGKGRSTQHDRGERSLLGPFAIAKEEELVFDHRSTQASAILIALGV